MPPDDQILVSTENDVAYAKVIGRGSFKVSGSLKEFGASFLKRDQHELVVDLAECIGMDSTFMGVLAGLSGRCKKEGAGKIVLVNLSDKTFKLISTLGLNHLVEFHMAGHLPDAYEKILGPKTRLSEINPDSLSEAERAKMMLESHVNLSELSKENQERFKDVVSYLRDEVDGLG